MHFGRNFESSFSICFVWPEISLCEKWLVPDSRLESARTHRASGPVDHLDAVQMKNVPWILYVLRISLLPVTSAIWEWIYWEHKHLLIAFDSYSLWSESSSAITNRDSDFVFFFLVIQIQAILKSNGKSHPFNVHIKKKMYCASNRYSQVHLQNKCRQMQSIYISTNPLKMAFKIDFKETQLFRTTKH